MGVSLCGRAKREKKRFNWHWYGVVFFPACVNSPSLCLSLCQQFDIINGQNLYSGAKKKEEEREKAKSSKEKNLPCPVDVYYPFKLIISLITLIISHNLEETKQKQSIKIDGSGKKEVNMGKDEKWASGGG